MRYKIMMGVLPGYGHENEKLTPEIALRIGKNAIEQRMPDNLKESCNVNFAAAVYAKGCPNGGELGISFSGEVTNKNDIKHLVNSVKMMMKDLGQSTVTIEWEDEGKLLASTYISEGGQEISHTKAIGLERFSVKIPADEIEFMTLGESLQKNMVEVSANKINNTGMYMISGILTKGIDSNGVRYYEYSGVQNPSYGQNDKYNYRKSVIATMQRVRENISGLVEDDIALLVDFEEVQVIVGSNVLERYLVRERDFEKYDNYDNYEPDKKEILISVPNGQEVQELPKTKKQKDFPHYTENNMEMER